MDGVLQRRSPPLRLPFVSLSKIVDLTGKVEKTSDCPIGCGGQAEIYKGQWIQDNGEAMMVAIKVILVLRRGSSAPDQQKLVREGRVWTGLSHPNIASFFGICNDLDTHGAPCFIIKYYPNGDLLQYLRDHGKKDRVQLMCQTAAGLVYLHAARVPIVHGDIKAKNILINDNGEACITDFGVARAVECSGFTTIAGSYRWMAPEFFDEISSLTTAVDVWAFAMTVLEVFTSQPPFYTINRELAVVRAVLAGALPQRQDYSGICDGVWRILIPCWKQQPTQRPSIHNVSIQLNLIAAHQPNTQCNSPDVILGKSKQHSGRSGHGDSAAFFAKPHAISQTTPRHTISLSKALPNPIIAPYPCYWEGCQAQFIALTECQAHQLLHEQAASLRHTAPRLSSHTTHSPHTFPSDNRIPSFG